MDDISMDPSTRLMDIGVIQAGIGANLLSLGLTGGMLFLSCLLIQIRKSKLG